MQRSQFLLGNLSKVLILVCALACANCSPNPKDSSAAFLEKLSSNGQWLNTGTKLKATIPVIGKIGDTVVAMIGFRTSRLFSGEPLVLQAKLYDFQPKAYFIEGFAFGELVGNAFRGQRVECNSLRLLRDNRGKMLFGGKFVVGQIRIELPLTEAQPAESFQDAFLRLDEFDGDRVPISWELKDIIDGALRTFEPRPELKSHVQEAKLLTWKIIGYYWWPGQGYYVGHCILWIRCDNPKQWTLAHVTHIARDTPFHWSLAWVEHSPLFWIKRYDHPPTKEEIETFLNANEWWSAPRELECKLLDAEICANAWEKVAG
jgi:hypothetical protein